jgi:hypothetical protein
MSASVTVNKATVTERRLTIWRRGNTKRKHNQADYEQPQRRAGCNAVSELDDRVERRSAGKPSAIAEWSLIAAPCARARRAHSRAPQHHRNSERQNDTSVCGEALLGRHLISSEYEDKKLDRKIHDACLQQLPRGYS